MPFCPISRMSLALGLIRGGGRERRALKQVGERLESRGRGPRHRSSFRAFPSSLPRAKDTEKAQGREFSCLLFSSGSFPSLVSHCQYYGSICFSPQLTSPPAPPPDNSFPEGLTASGCSVLHRIQPFMKRKDALEKRDHHFQCRDQANATCACLITMQHTYPTEDVCSNLGKGWGLEEWVL